MPTKLSRAERRAARRERRNGLANRLTDFIHRFLDSEFQKLRTEYIQKQPMQASSLSFANVIKTVRTDLLKEGTAAAQTADLVLKLHAKFKEQIRIVLEVAVANGYNVEKLPKEAVVYVILDALSRKNLGLAVISTQNKTIGLKLQGQEVSKKIAQILAFVLVGLLVRSALVRYVPVAGELINALLGPAGNQMNIKVFEKIKALCAENYEFHLENNSALKNTDLNTAEEVVPEPTESNNDRDNLNYLLALISLAHKDGLLADNEKENIHTFMANSDLDDAELALVNTALENPQATFDLEALKQDRDSADALLSDLIALSGIDGSITTEENTYIVELGQKLGFSHEDIMRRLV
ncbi:MAG: DUF533 domain-containing protein [Cytophagales bacterium]|nr:MAG: DUF533 domain-containing protein [Cytophagales bacterium]TAF61113.1 MAG: DUF533 domain-containing protein [Cytophagales bacterium]